MNSPPFYRAFVLHWLPSCFNGLVGNDPGGVRKALLCLLNEVPRKDELGSALRVTCPSDLISLRVGTASSTTIL